MRVYISPTHEVRLIPEGVEVPEMPKKGLTIRESLYNRDVWHIVIESLTVLFEDQERVKDLIFHKPEFWVKSESNPREGKYLTPTGLHSIPGVEAEVVYQQTDEQLPTNNWWPATEAGFKNPKLDKIYRKVARLKEGEKIKCETCGQDFDPSNLSSVFVHMHRDNSPELAAQSLGIKAKKVSAKEEAKGRGWCKCSNEEQHGETSVMCCNHCGLPTEEFWQKPSSSESQEELFNRLLSYSDRYEISFQLWPQQYTIYITKDGVELGEFASGFDNAKETLEHAIEYLDRITRNTKQ